jgi:hypothetical protein
MSDLRVRLYGWAMWLMGALSGAMVTLLLVAASNR